jgi:hypothetical protein
LPGEYSSGSRSLEVAPIVLSEGSVQQAIYELNSKGASAQDGVTAGMLKALGELGTGTLTQIFEGALNGDSVSWGEVLITLLPKVDHPSHAKDFRPISVLPVLFKAFEKVLLKVAEETPPSYFSGLLGYRLGFRPGCQAEENISSIRWTTEKAREYEVPSCVRSSMYVRPLIECRTP